MKGFDWKRLLAAVIKMGFTALFLGFLLTIVAAIASLTGWPPYLQRALWAAACALLLVCIILVSGYPGPRLRRRLGLGFAAVLAGCCIYCGYGYWKSSIPTVDDRALSLREYVPFQEGSKAVTPPWESTLRFSRPDQLHLDGATALYPVYASFVQAVYPEDTDRYSPFQSAVECTGTVTAYERLIRREVDVIFAAAPSQQQLDMAREAGMELHLTPIGREAFVFFVNSKNPVESLSVEEIQKIYTGECTNWRQVGGKNWSIRPFQRMENSGSQSALLRMMDGLPLMEPEQEDRVASMGGIIREVASYRNYRNAIGFSFRFYTTEMAASDDIRLLALDGVAPTVQSIRDGSYPLTSEFYAVTGAPAGQPAPQESNPDLAEFLSWVQSRQGQEIIEMAGYVGLD